MKQYVYVKENIGSASVITFGPIGSPVEVIFDEHILKVVDRDNYAWSMLEKGSVIEQVNTYFNGLESFATTFEEASERLPNDVMTIQVQYTIEVPTNYADRHNNVADICEDIESRFKSGEIKVDNDKHLTMFVVYPSSAV